MTDKICPFYVHPEKYTKGSFCTEQLPSDETCCTNLRYYTKGLESKNKELEEHILHLQPTGICDICETSCQNKLAIAQKALKKIKNFVCRVDGVVAGGIGSTKAEWVQHDSETVSVIVAIIDKAISEINK